MNPRNSHPMREMGVLGGHGCVSDHTAWGVVLSDTGTWGPAVTPRRALSESRECGHVDPRATGQRGAGPALLPPGDPSFCLRPSPARCCRHTAIQSDVCFLCRRRLYVNKVINVP